MALRTFALGMNADNSEIKENGGVLLDFKKGSAFRDEKRLVDLRHENSYLERNAMIRIFMKMCIALS